MSLKNHIKWQSIDIPGLAAEGQLSLTIGTVGSGEPTAVITAGVHGDEGPWGAWAVDQMLQAISPEQLVGTLRIIPVANPLAMQADLRNAPVDQLDLNRAFPGDAEGSYTERVAHAIVTHALDDADYVIDLHGGGSWCVNAFVFEMADSKMLSDAFDAPFVVRAPDRTVTLTGYAKSQGAQVCAVEMGGRSAYEGSWSNRIAQGLMRALVNAGVVQGLATPPKTTEAIPLGKSQVLRPQAGGIFVPVLGADRVGQIVAEGTQLGYVMHPVTHTVLETFVAPFAETAIMLLRPYLCRIEGGAMTYVVASPQVD
ncbi:MAG: succinylglutamate desuccinylase/aspartoacylase family protein [Anaerolineae bacterium]